MRRMNIPKAEFFKGAGCSNCEDTGYRGRTAISEVMLMDEPLRKAIMDQAAASEIHKLAREEGMITLQEDGLAQARKGLTTVDEIARSV